MQKQNNFRFRSQGQGVVEYCGALIVAVVMVAIVLGGGVDGMVDVFSTIVSSAHDTLLGFLPS